MAVKIGFAGSGGIANAHMEVLKQIEDAEVVACMDLDEERAARLAAEKEETLKAAYEQTRRTIEKTKVRAEEIISTAKVDAKREANRILAETRRQIEQERTQMEQELRRAYAELSVLGASQVLSREVRLEDHRRLLDELIAGIDEEALRMRQ